MFWKWVSVSSASGSDRMRHLFGFLLTRGECHHGVLQLRSLMEYATLLMVSHQKQSWNVFRKERMRRFAVWRCWPLLWAYRLSPKSSGAEMWLSSQITKGLKQQPAKAQPSHGIIVRSSMRFGPWLFKLGLTFGLSVSQRTTTFRTSHLELSMHCCMTNLMHSGGSRSLEDCSWTCNFRLSRGAQLRHHFGRHLLRIDLV